MINTFEAIFLMVIYTSQIHEDILLNYPLKFAVLPFMTVYLAHHFHG